MQVWISPGFRLITPRSTHAQKDQWSERSCSDVTCDSNADACSLTGAQCAQVRLDAVQVWTSPEFHVVTPRSAQAQKHQWCERSCSNVTCDSNSDACSLTGAQRAQVRLDAVQVWISEFHAITPRSTHAQKYQWCERSCSNVTCDSNSDACSLTGTQCAQVRLDAVQLPYEDLMPPLEQPQLQVEGGFEDSGKDPIGGAGNATASTQELCR